MILLWKKNFFNKTISQFESYNFTISETRSSLPEVFLGEGVLKICSKFTGEHPCKATLLKSHFDMGVLLLSCCIFLEHFFLRTPLENCFCKTNIEVKIILLYHMFHHLGLSDQSQSVHFLFA